MVGKFLDHVYSWDLHILRSLIFLRMYATNNMLVGSDLWFNFGDFEFLAQCILSVPSIVSVVVSVYTPVLEASTDSTLPLLL